MANGGTGTLGGSSGNGNAPLSKQMERNEDVLRQDPHSGLGTLAQETGGLLFDSTNNLAGCLHVLGDAVSALPLYRRALEGRERMLGPDHPDTLISLNNLAGCLGTLGDPAAALPLLKRALDGSERVLGKEHPQTERTRRKADRQGL